MPNKNSYLSLALSANTRDNLAHVQAELARSVAAQSGGASFSPMAWEDLHITFFFGGERLAKLPAATVEAWAAAVRGAICAGGFTHTASLRFAALEPFPPGKGNLIVARFDADKVLHELQSRLTTIWTDMVGDPCGIETNAWIAHCTLGKVYASKAAVVAVAERAIKGAECSQACEALLHVRTSGLVFCGCVPMQRGFDWESILRFVPELGVAAAPAAPLGLCWDTA